jgi:hypothetical protein
MIRYCLTLALIKNLGLLTLIINGVQDYISSKMRALCIQIQYMATMPMVACWKRYGHQSTPFMSDQPRMDR